MQPCGCFAEIELLGNSNKPLEVGILGMLSSALQSGASKASVLLLIHFLDHENSKSVFVLSKIDNVTSVRTNSRLCGSCTASAEPNEQQRCIWRIPNVHGIEDRPHR